MKYTGSGGENWDVARETGGSAMMESGETYEVSEELAKRLLLTEDWEAPASRERELSPARFPDATEGARERAEELGVDLHEVEGTGRDGRITKSDVETHAQTHAGEAGEPEGGE